MQLYARDISGKKCFAPLAQKGIDYFCLECSARVRVRSGLQVRPHFFHTYDAISCRQAGKTEEHIAIQGLIQAQLGEEISVEEMRFAEIGRVADVAWPDKKLIFEVQCSPISAQEIEERNRDYGSCGWDVVWILYDKTFLQAKLTSAERYLLFHTHYFSDATCIYDQCFDIQNKRSALTLKRPLQIDKIKPITFVEKLPKLPDVLLKRFYGWGFYIVDDYLWNAMHVKNDDISKELFAFCTKRKTKLIMQVMLRLQAALRALWHLILERSCS